MAFTQSLIAQDIPRCFDATPADYEASLLFENSILTPAAGLNTELSIPLHIIYVNDNAGTPPFNDYRISEEIVEANAVFDGFLNFYVCGYHHINSSNYSEFNFGQDREGLFNTYHVDDAVNVYIVKTVDDARAKAAFPWLVGPNNCIFLSSSFGSFTHTLAHELGHYFGLFHTHTVVYQSPNLCLLQDPGANTDMVDDTPYDPGPNIAYCQQECPKALTPCTLTCNVNQPPVTYTYSGYYTDNVMSYHNCATQRFTTGQINRMKFYLNNEPSRTFLLSANPSCNNNIAENGFVNKYCQASTPNPDITPTKDILIDMRNEVTGWEGPRRKTENSGEYLHSRNDYSNLSYVTINPVVSHPNVSQVLLDPTVVPPNYAPFNGCDIYDVVVIGKHMNNETPFSSAYQYIAADVNMSGTITTWDKASITRVALGITPDFPAGTWHYVPEYYFNNQNFATGFDSDPFTASYAGLNYPDYLDEVVLDMDDVTAADPATWSFRGIKMGDLNCDMMIDQLLNPNDGDVSSGFAIGDCVQNNDIITISVQGSVSQPLLAYDLCMEFDDSKLSYLGSSSGNLVDYNPEYFNKIGNEIRTLWHRSDFLPESFTTSKTLFKLHFKAMDGFCSLSDAFDLKDSSGMNIFYDGDIESMQGNVVFSYQKVSPVGSLATIYPNPASSTVTFGFQLNQASMVEIRLSDYLGGVINASQSYNSGPNYYTFPSLSGLANGPINYTVKMGNLTYSGIIVKNLP